jgi:hypothetical protein
MRVLTPHAFANTFHVKHHLRFAATTIGNLDATVPNVRAIERRSHIASPMLWCRGASSDCPMRLDLHHIPIRLGNTIVLNTRSTTAGAECVKGPVQPPGLSLTRLVSRLRDHRMTVTSLAFGLGRVSTLSHDVVHELPLVRRHGRKRGSG